MRTFLLVFSLSMLAACGTPTDMTCSPANCGGCCNADGQCVDGTANNACGSAGLLCTACGLDQSCQAKRCESGTVVDMDAGVDAGVVDAGNPIVAPAETWTWTAFPGSACGNGAETGVGVNLTNKSNDVLIYLMGGGACWNALTCDPRVGAATYVDTGYAAAQFSQENVLGAGPFQRGNAANPFKDMSFVFVPYCTGDVHGGDKVTTYPPQSTPLGNIPERTIHHKGAANMALFIERLRDTFPNAQRVFISGSSAGAYGAQLNFPKLKDAFPNAEVHSYADCGQMINPSGTLLSEWVASWNMQAPAACVDCTSDFTKYPKWLNETYPTSRFALLAYTQDQTLRTFFSYSAADFETQTGNLLTSAYDGQSNARYFVVDDPAHVMLLNFFTLQGPGNVSLVDWTSSFVAGTGAWANVKP